MKFIEINDNEYENYKKYRDSVVKEYFKILIKYMEGNNTSSMSYDMPIPGGQTTINIELDYVLE